MVLSLERDPRGSSCFVWMLETGIPRWKDAHGPLSYTPAGAGVEKNIFRLRIRACRNWIMGYHSGKSLSEYEFNLEPFKILQSPCIAAQRDIFRSAK